ncbi:MAG TPA: PAS domain S-box protein, partial [Candidatus Caenarcaniphilales bacterium]
MIEVYQDISQAKHDEVVRKQAEVALRQQTEREQLVAQIAQRIRCSLNTEVILNTTVAEVRAFLQADRVFIYRFEPDSGGIVIAESAGSGWNPILGHSLKDSTFAEAYVQSYRQGRIQATADIDAAALTPCYVEFLAQLQVKAALVVPILQGEALWGLLVANQCLQPRQWQQWEIDLLKQLATHVAIALQQSELYHQAQTELAERRQAEAALRESEERYRRIIETAEEGVWLIDAENLTTFANGKMAEMLGYTVNEMLGRPLLSFMDAEAQVVAATLLSRRRQGIREQHDFQFRAKDGSALWTILSCNPIFNPAGQYAGALAMVTDITQRKQAEQKIYEQAALLDISPDAILVRDLHEQIRFWSQGAERLFGWTAQEAVGKNWRTLLFKKTSSQLEAALKAVVEKGEWQGELHKVTQSGQQITVDSRWTLMRDGAGKPKSILSVDTDITEKKNLEAQFLRAQRMESIGTLAGGIAHDLNNVLAPILMSVQLLKLKLPDEQRQRLLAILETNTRRGADLVKQVVSFTQGIEGKRTILPVRQLILEAQKMVQETFPKSIEVH